MVEADRSRAMQDVKDRGTGGRALVGVLRDQLPLVLLTGAYVGAIWGIDLTTGLSPADRLGWGSLLTAIGFATGFTLLVTVCLLTVFALSWLLGLAFERENRARPFGSPWSVWRVHLSGERVAGAFVTLFLYAELMNAFVGFKGQIPAIQPFVWDEAFMRLDRLLHLGHDPWVLLQPLVGTPVRTAIVDRLYYLWFPVNVIFLLAFAWRPADRLRSRFFLALFGLWIILGTAMALAFSSAGPCYYGRVVSGPDPFAPLIAYLGRVDSVYPLTALDVQAILWEGYVGRAQLVEGIAAMPSLHVAVPVLFTLVTWGLDRRLGILCGLYTVSILVGSVHLAWHYAIDGYVTLALVPVIWWLAGRLARRYPSS